MNSKENVAVIGLGFWGTALAEYLARIGHQVIGWSNQKEVIDKINSTGKNPNCFSNVPLSFLATSSLEDALLRSVIVVTLPAKTIIEFKSLLSLPPTKLIISAMKGFEPVSKNTPIQYLINHNCQADCAVISGPSFAIDVISQTPVAVSSGAKTLDIATKVANIFNSNKMRLYPTDDLIGVELGGALKNIIAVAAGIANGLKLGDSTKAALITRGLAEMNRYAQFFGAKSHTIFGLSGLGDLILTTSSHKSRNYSFGDKIGQGLSIEEALLEVGSTVEGYYSSLIVYEVSRKNNLEMPITECLFKLLTNKISAVEMISKLMSRPIKNEAI